jgi:hypothetical protein
MTGKNELVKEHECLVNELKEVYERLDNMRPKVTDVEPLLLTKESLKEYNLLCNKREQIKKRMRDITREITQLPKDK